MTRMKRGIVPVEIVPPADGHEVVFRVREPGIVRKIGFALKERQVVVSLTNNKGPQFDEVGVIFFECDPEGEQRDRKFAIVPVRRGLEAEPGTRIEWRGTEVSQRTGSILNVFEVPELDAIGELVAAQDTTKDEPS